MTLTLLSYGNSCSRAGTKCLVNIICLNTLTIKVHYFDEYSFIKRVHLRTHNYCTEKPTYSYTETFTTKHPPVHTMGPLPLCKTRHLSSELCTDTLSTTYQERCQAGKREILSSNSGYCFFDEIQSSDTSRIA